MDLLAPHVGPWAIYEPAARLLQSRHERVLRVSEERVAQAVEASAARDGDDDDVVEQITKIHGAGVASVRIHGALSRRPLLSRQLFGSPPTYGEVAAAIDGASADPEIETVLLHLDDAPGGSVAGLHLVLAAIGRARAGGRRIVALADELTASAAYWIASQADEVYAVHETTEIGSIGVYAVLLDSSQSQADRGVRAVVVSSGGVKGLGADGKVTEELEADVRRQIEGIHELFVAAVAEGRRITSSSAAALGDGRLHLAADAQSLGLIDGVRSYRELLVELRGTTTTTGGLSMSKTSAAPGPQPATEPSPDTTATREAEDSGLALELSEAHAALAESRQLRDEVRRERAELAVDRAVGALGDVPPAALRGGVREALVALNLSGETVAVSDGDSDEERSLYSVVLGMLEGIPAITAIGRELSSEEEDERLQKGFSREEVARAETLGLSVGDLAAAERSLRHRDLEEVPS